ncbi:MAG TPA: DegT/DnrJ/EryC1/StrS family aminotransferase, partial [Polyangia bacterium]
QCRMALDADRSIRFVVPVHLYGHALDLTKLRSLKQDFGVRVLEDCCQAIGAASGLLRVGDVGDASALSFYPTKNLGAMGDGGALLTDDPHLDAAGRALRDYGQSSRNKHDVLGLNSRLDELHAAMLTTALLPRLPAWTAKRRTIARAYLDGIAHPRVTVPGAPPYSQSVWHLFPVLVSGQHREHFRAHLDAASVTSAIHYPELIPRQRALADIHGPNLVSLARAERYCQMEVSLPIHPYMTDGEVARVVNAVNRWVCP